MTKDLMHPHINLGVEIEVEGIFDPSDISSPGWNVTGDGSLRGGGAELVFDGPARGTTAKRRLKQALNMLEDVGAVSNYRTSMHVHADISSAGLKRSGLVRAVVFYILAERALFAWEGNNRECSNFCVPVFKAGRSLDQFAEACAAPSVDARRQRLNVMMNQRYAALNFHAIYKFNTLEFRHMITTFDYDRAITWINLVTSLMQAANATRVNMQAFSEWLTTAETQEVVQTMYPAELIEELGYDTLSASVESGMHTALGFISATGLLDIKPRKIGKKSLDPFFNPTIQGGSKEDHPIVKKIKANHSVI